jgi:preprotein translocase subunit SecE
MNRQTKRMMQRQRQAERAPRQPRPAAPERRKRVGPGQFLREVRQELKKVAWPSRRELFAYTMVVLVSVAVLTSFVFGLDFLIARAVLFVFGGGQTG